MRKRNLSAHREYNRVYQREHREMCRAKGMCVDCFAFVAGVSRCECCRMRFNLKRRRG